MNNRIDELLDIMAQLRDKDTGCPWDLKQTFATIIPYTLEEAYEVADAIEHGTPDDIRQELGDLLLQIIYYSQMAKENAWFDFDDVVQTLQEKLVRRHPHVFGHQKRTSAEQHHEEWEKLKSEERQQKQQNSVLANVPKSLPALVRAQKLQNRAASVGFDWPNIYPVLEKIHEELDEFKHAYETKDKTAAQEELGDIFFVLANLARHMKVDAESVMRQANHKFERRFNGVEERVKMSGKEWQDFSLDDLEAFWVAVKEQE